MSNVFVDIAPIDKCENIHSYGCVCVKCNKCGRFDKELKEKNVSGEVKE